MNKIRTFIAVDVDESVRRRAARLIERLATSAGNVKWVEPQNMHLTLQFLGDVPQPDVHEVCLAVRRAVVGCVPFAMSLLGAGAFPHAGRPSTFWIGVDEGAQQLKTLQRRIQQTLKPLGFPPERRAYHPHLTIGRIRRGSVSGGSQLASDLRDQQSFDAGRSTVDQVIVYASYLERTGPSHQPMSRIVLPGAPSNE
ncbi:MAG: RNA 2',3'-cyclic phosphodiesterase [Planctomycetaceae bacterium]|nr:MAG: RNA 2',3'-cyclic phosphodiesterase [Planctomycetaceae bacterium]